MPGQTLGTRKAQNVQNLCFRPVDQTAGDVLPDNEVELFLDCELNFFNGNKVFFCPN